MSDKLQGGILAGATSVSLPFVLRKTTDNTEATGKVASDMTLSYWRQGGTRTAISGSDLAAVNSAYSSGGVKEVDATNEPGLYRLDVPDAAVATGADWVVISVKVASSYVFHERFALTTNVVQSGDSFARLGAPAGASNAADVAAIKAETASIQGDTNDIQTRLPAALTANGNMKSSLVEILTTALTETAGQLAGGFKKFFNIATPASTMDALTSVATATNLTNAPGAGDFTAAMKTSLNAATPAVTVSDKTGFALTAAYDAAKTAAQAGNAMTLTSGERTAVANEVEAQIIDDTDSEKVLQAITDKIAAVNPSLAGLTLAAIASAVWAAAQRTLTAGTNIALAKGVGITGFNDLSAAQVNAEADTAIADAALATAATLALVKTSTDNLPSDPADESLIIAATNAIVTLLGTPAGASVSIDIAAMRAIVDAITAKTANLPASPAAVGSAMTLTSAYDFAKGTVAMVESYAARHAGMTPVQALHELRALLAERSIVGVTLNAKKLDGAALAATYTLDDATNPTSQTRAT